MVWRITLFALLGITALTAAGTRAEGGAEEARSGQRDRYVLEATLDPARKVVQGRLRITLHNRSDVQLRELVFHLYMNAFADRESVFMRESRGALRGRRSRGRGSITLASLSVDGVDVLARAERELIEGDRTQLRAALPAPLAVGASVSIESEFTVQLPPLFARSGFVDDRFFAVAQWFPKLAKLEPSGTFASFPYHGLGEFYADFADYTLTVRAPAAFAVVASGTEVDSKREGAAVIRRFEAPAVHDVMFVAARHMRDTRVRMEGVELRCLAPTGYEEALAEHRKIVAAGLRRFGEAYGRYPYPTLTMVLPPRAAAGGAGMEYPTLFLTAGEWLVSSTVPSLSGGFVTAHELAHQWFQGVIASDEVQHPVLDEGLAQWASLDLMRAIYGAREGLLGLRFDRFEIERLLSQRPTPSIAPGKAAYAYSPGEYAASVYARAALALESVRRAHGNPRFMRALARYAAEQRFRHPTPAALVAAFDAEYGGGFGERVLAPLLFGGERVSVHLAEARTRRSGDRWITYVRARREGTVALPTAAAVYAADGRELTRRPWPAPQEALELAIQTREPVARLVLDPDRTLLTDPDTRDQVAVFTPPRDDTWVAHAVALAQALLAWVGP